jgi:DNA-directed RNA polymerase II subunit RPB9
MLKLWLSRNKTVAKHFFNTFQRKKFSKPETTMNFCPECNNMLYPVEEKQTKKLKLICRICNFQQAAQNPCVYTNNIKELEEAKNIAWTDVPYDPTLTRTYTTRCSKCNGKEAVFLQVCGDIFYIRQ